MESARRFRVIHEAAQHDAWYPQNSPREEKRQEELKNPIRNLKLEIKKTLFDSVATGQ